MVRLQVMRRYKIKPDRSSRAREATVGYKAPASYSSLEVPGVYHVTVTDRGRLVLPVELRNRLKIRGGDRLAVILQEDGTISIKTREVALNNLQGMFKHLAPRDHFASDDLIAERRRQARMEEREFCERSVLDRRMKRERMKRL